MVGIGGMTTVGLALLGIPLAGALGLLAGLMSFIPNIGPVIATIPALLVAFLQSPERAVYTLLIYMLIQGLNGYVLAPLVDRRSIDMSPVLAFAAQIVFGIAFGFIGVVLAIPLTAVMAIFVKKLYVERLSESDAQPV